MTQQATAAINNRPRSITTAQIRALFAAGRKLGLSSDAVREAAGGSVRSLSRSDASDLIERLGGGELPHAPGDPWTTHYRRPRRRPVPGIIRMISDRHCELIAKMLTEVFKTEDAGAAWLKKYFGFATPRELGSEKRAGEVIHVLKKIKARRVAKESDDR